MLPTQTAKEQTRMRIRAITSYVVVFACLVPVAAEPSRRSRPERADA
jgi:hypothetical protein